MAQTPRPRVVFVLPALTAGGAERVLITLMNGIDRTEFAPAMLCVNDGGPLRYLAGDELPFRSLSSTGHLRVLHAIPRLYRALRDMKPDIVVSTMAHMNFVILLLRPFFPRTRFIVREAITPSFILKLHPLLKPAVAAAYALLYPMAFRVISPAQMIRDEFIKIFRMNPRKHVLLPNPVDAEKMRGDGRAAPPLPPGTVRFVAAGRLNNQKGFDRLIDILPRIQGDWHLTILGEGEERAALAAQIEKLNLQSRVSLPGFSPNPWPLYAAADALLLPSRCEGMPNVALESLCCGTPVIAMEEAGGIVEIAAAAPQSVTLCQTMDDFAAAMARTTAQRTETFRPSLLPRAFERAAVIGEFTKILRLAAAPRA